jgi:hypothetical protein
MRLFYVKQVKHFILLGAGITLLIGIVARVINHQVGTQEIMFHTNLRNNLGHPFTYYSPLAIIVLTLLYEFFYALIGGLLGYIFFMIKHRHSGFTVFFTQTFKTGIALVFIVCLFLFLKVDVVNQYDNAVMSKIPHPGAITIGNSGFMKTLADLFLPSLRAVPERGFPQQSRKATQHSIIPSDAPESNSPQTSSSQSQAPASTTHTFVPIPTAATKPVIQPFIPPPTTVQMPSASQLFAGLNTYRSQHGVSQLKWDATLADYSSQLAEQANHRGAIDGGQNLRQVRSQNPFALGFQNLGELQSYGVTESATGLFSNYFAAYASTNITQSSSDWQYVGIGVNGTAVEVILGARKCASTNRGGCQ